MDQNTATFSIDIVGDQSGKTWKGQFECRIRLSLRQQLRYDEIRRLLLGEAGSNPSIRAANIAETIAFCRVRLVKAPQWWEANGEGLDFEDDNVLGEISTRIAEAVNADADKKKTDAEAVRSDMATELKSAK